MTTASLANGDDGELQRHLHELSTLSAERARLRHESDLLDSQLLLLNTVLWMKKLQQFTRHRRKQPFTLRLTATAPPASPSLLPLTLHLTNSTPIHLCTPAPACFIHVSIRLTHLPTSSTLHHSHCHPCPHPLWRPNTQWTHSLSLRVGWAPAECTATCDVSLQYQLPASAAQPPAADTPHPTRAFALPLGRVEWTGGDLSQALRPMRPPSSLHTTIHAILSPVSPPLTPLAPSLTALFPAGEGGVAGKGSWAVALLSVSALSPANNSASRTMPTLYQQLLASPLQPHRPPSAVKWGLGGGVEVRLEMRQVGDAPALVVPFMRVAVADVALVPAAQAHVGRRLRAWLAEERVTSGGEVGERAGGNGGVEVAASALAQWVTLLFDAHLLPRSMQLADLLSQVRQAQLQFAQLVRAVRENASLSTAEVEGVWQRCVQRVLALYTQSRRAGSAEPSSMEGAVLVM